VQLAFALGRKVGNAVQRNRLRRRLRHVFTELVSQGRVPAGVYLVTASPDAVECSFEELRRFVQRAVAHIAEGAGR
jgi:ribonuclease P protein component